ncbi:MAG: PKD domain-containing protein [Desulfocapsaceae bacterium]|nr:PKD domain-containing protein [Desulfocapsaceae bacterium]
MTVGMAWTNLTRFLNPPTLSERPYSYLDDQYCQQAQDIFTPIFISRPSYLWRQLIQPRLPLIFSFLPILLVLALPTSVMATVSKQFHFEWKYDINLPGLSGYIIYKNNQHLLTINSPAITDCDIDVDLEPGQTIVFTMKAFDLNGNESAISAPYSFNIPAEVINNNFLPSASLNISTLSGEAPLAVDFIATESTDFDGTISSYAWDFGDSTSASTCNASHIYTTPGIYIATLTVTDNDGGTASAQATVTVSALPSNKPPTASLTLSTSSGKAPLTVYFSAAESTDFDGSILSYAWDFGDGASANTSNASHTYMTAGVYTATLTIVDNDASVVTTQATITILPSITNIPPKAHFYTTTESVHAPLIINFDGSNSTDSDGTITTYSWNFGDGSSATGAHVSHIYTIAGSFTAKLTVTDDKGGQDTYEQVIFVETAMGQPITPVAAITLTPQVPTIHDAVQFSGTASTVSTGNIIHYLWDFGDGENGVDGIVSHRYEIPGIYTVTLTVWDGYDNSSYKKTSLTVKSLGNTTQKSEVIRGAQNAILFLLLKNSNR